MNKTSLGYLYQRGKKGIWSLQYTKNGKTTNVSLKTTSRKEAESKRKELLHQHATEKKRKNTIDAMLFEACNIKCGDCLELMKDIPDKSIDMVIADLPFGSTNLAWDKIIPFDKLWKHYERIIKDTGAICLFGSEPFSTHLKMSNLKWFKYEWIWNKSKPTGFINARNAPLKAHENILIFSKGTIANESSRLMNYNPQGLELSGKICKSKTDDSFIGTRKSRQEDYVQKFKNFPTSVLNFQSVKKTIHPTQKPVALFEYLIKTYTNERELVLDNCAGSFTTAIACDNTKRNWICMEKEQEFCDLGRKRINDNRIEIYRSKIKQLEEAIDSLTDKDL